MSAKARGGIKKYLVMPEIFTSTSSKCCPGSRTNSKKKIWVFYEGFPTGKGHEIKLKPLQPTMTVLKILWGKGVGNVHWLCCYKGTQV